MSVLIKMWTEGVYVEDQARQQLHDVASMPFIHSHIAVLPDVHLGYGATIGSVIPTIGAIIPAAVGVDLGCGMVAVRTTLTASMLPDSLSQLRTRIEQAVPCGRTNDGRKGDTGAWSTLPDSVGKAWAKMEPGFKKLYEKHPKLEKCNNVVHLGTLGTGNHFVEVCLDTEGRVWVMLHSGSRGVGNRIGSYFIALAKKDMEHHIKNLPNKDLAYLNEGTEHFGDYVEAVDWAQTFARVNRDLMLSMTLDAMRTVLPSFQIDKNAVNCHHNYISREHHFGENVWVTRKGAVSAQLGELGIIPGSMGAKSFIVKGKGNPDSFHSCSHGAGRAMSRTEAKRRFTVEDHEKATQGVECRKDIGVIDETPAAYKDIDAVMAAQKDLVSIEHTLKQIVCVKG